MMLAGDADGVKMDGNFFRICAYVGHSSKKMLVILHVPQAASTAKSLGARNFVLRASPHLDGQWKTRASKPQKHVLNVCWDKSSEV